MSYNKKIIIILLLIFPLVLIPTSPSTAASIQQPIISYALSNSSYFDSISIVTINGSGFGNIMGTVNFNYGGGNISNVQWTDNQIQVYLNESAHFDPWRDLYIKVITYDSLSSNYYNLPIKGYIKRIELTSNKTTYTNKEEAEIKAIVYDGENQPVSGKTVYLELNVAKLSDPKKNLKGAEFKVPANTASDSYETSNGIEYDRLILQTGPGGSVICTVGANTTEDKTVTIRAYSNAGNSQIVYSSDLMIFFQIAQNTKNSAGTKTNTTTPATLDTVPILTNPTPPNNPPDSNNTTNSTDNEAISFYVNGARAIFPDIEPYINKENHTMVPIRFISESLGAKVDWDQANKIAKISLKNQQLTIGVKDKITIVNNQTLDIDTSAELKDSRIMVPLRFISEALGAKVKWDPDNKKVDISL